MVGFILLILGLAIAGIPVGIISIVHCARVKGKNKAILLPASIIGLVLTSICFVVSLSIDDSATVTALYFGGLAISIVTLSVAVHYQRKAKNMIYENKKKEHEESVLHTNNQITYYGEIKALKDLLDSGAISQEEYDKKKTEILNRK